MLNPYLKNHFLLKWLNTLNLNKIILHLIGVVLGIFYFIHVTHIFENVTKFSHLTNIERELSLPVDVAFRYGFYKRIGESSSFLEGLQGIIQDKDMNYDGNFNRFRQYYLTPEVVQAAGFHLFIKFKKWTGLFNKCTEERRHGSMFVVNKERNENGIFICTSGLENLFYFYFNFIWVIESFMVTLLFHFGFILSESKVVSLVAVFFFIISHPQRTMSDWLFPSQIKLEWAVFLVQIYIISNLALRKTHPSWTTTVKIGICTGVLILVAQTETQWLLISQLVIITIMQIIDLVNPYVTSLIIFGQITGWQYASLVSVDISFKYWSFYLYTLMSSIIIIYILEPIVDWILGVKLPKFIIARRTLLIITYQIVFILIWKESHRVLGGLPEDMRLSFAFQPNAFNSNLTSSSVELTSEPSSKNYDESGGKLDKDLEKDSDLDSKHTTYFNTTSILQFCSENRLKMSPLSFISKYGFHVLVVLYVVAVCIFFPVTSLKASRRTASEARDKRRKASSLSSSSSSRLNQLNSFVHIQNPIIIFNLLQTVAFAFYTIFLDKRWELLFVSHLCLIISLLCEQKRILLTYRKKISNKFGNGAFIHWLVVLIIFCIIFTMGKLRSNNMYQNSRGRFEIENQKRKHFTESMAWINENTEKMSTVFVGVDIPMLYVRLTTGRSCVTLRQRYDIHYMLEQDETQQVNVKMKFGLTTMTWNEIHDRIYSMYSRRKSISEYYTSLISFNITHLFLNGDACSTSTTSTTTSVHSITKYNILLETPKIESVIPMMTHFYDFIWKWDQNSIDEHDILSWDGFQTFCDLTPLWDLVNGEMSTITTNKQRSNSMKNVLPNTWESMVKENRNKLETESSRKRKNKVEPKAVVVLDDTVCVRLLNERNVKPFTRVFENSDYTILSLNQKQPHSRSRNNKNQVRDTRS